MRPPAAAEALVLWAARRAALLCAALGLLLGLLSLPNGFAIDDAYLVVNNPQIRDLHRVPGFFIQAWGNGSGDPSYQQVNAAYYRPLSSALLALEYALFGLHPAGFHLVSALLHALCTAVSTALFGVLLGRGPWALVAGLMFALHPIHTEALAAVTYQTTLLAGTLSVAALWLAAQAQAQPRAWAEALGASAVGGLTLLALLAKEEAAGLALLVAALGLWQWRRGVPLRRAAASPLAAGIALGLFLGIRAQVVHASGITYFAGAPASAVVFTMLKVVWLYAGLLVAPLQLCPFYDWFIVPIELQPAPESLLGAAVLLAAVGVSVRGLRAGSVAGLGLSWVLLGLLPVMQIIPILNVAAERFLYLPSVGWVLCGAAAARWAWQRGPRIRPALVLMLVLVLGGYGARSAARMPDWRDDLTLNRVTAADFPQTPTPLLNLAPILGAAGRWAEAEAALVEAVRRAPEFPPAIQKLAALRRRAPPVPSPVH